MINKCPVCSTIVLDDQDYYTIKVPTGATYGKDGLPKAMYTDMKVHKFCGAIAKLRVNQIDTDW
jgi:hypothetical protein